MGHPKEQSNMTQSHAASTSTLQHGGVKGRSDDCGQYPGYSLQLARYGRIAASRWQGRAMQPAAIWPGTRDAEHHVGLAANILSSVMDRSTRLIGQGYKHRYLQSRVRGVRTKTPAFAGSLIVV